MILERPWAGSPPPFVAVAMEHGVAAVAIIAVAVRQRKSYSGEAFSVRVAASDCLAPSRGGVRLMRLACVIRRCSAAHITDDTFCISDYARFVQCLASLFAKRPLQARKVRDERVLRCCERCARLARPKLLARTRLMRVGYARWRE